MISVRKVDSSEIDASPLNVHCSAAFDHQLSAYFTNTSCGVNNAFKT